MMKIKCINCNKEFVKQVWNAKACSGYCNLKSWRKNNPEKNQQIKMDWRRRNGVLDRNSPEYRLHQSQTPKATGEQHGMWRGDDVGYEPLHLWVRRQCGDASYCAKDKSHQSKRYVWANISGQYQRNLEDWWQLCTSCNLTDGVKKHPRFIKEAV